MGYIVHIAHPIRLINAARTIDSQDVVGIPAKNVESNLMI
jgi:hypothetical protein